MKTPEEIKKGLQYCSENTWCVGSECPYYEITDCDTYIAEDALALIEQLERERDAAVEDIPRDCHKCKHFKVLFNGCTPDCDCDLSDVCEDNDKWEWQGVKEKKDENTR